MRTLDFCAVLLHPTILALLIAFSAPSSSTAFRLPFSNLDSDELNNSKTSRSQAGRSDAVPHAGPRSLLSAPPRLGDAAKRDPRLRKPTGLPSYSNNTSLRERMQEYGSPVERDLDTIPDTWFISRAFQGESFFDNWGFATYADPTHGQVTYVSREWATQTNMSYVNNKGQAVMRVDNWSTLTQGQARNSIRIESNDIFNKGLFILDVEQAPWGCGVWPAWWTVGGNWPYQGEIDILEYPDSLCTGVHDNVHNQVTYHTGQGCHLDPPTATTPSTQNLTGLVASTDCYAYGSSSGCAVIDPSVASYGTQFNVLGGGVFAMLWLDDAIRVWFFHRAAIPSDIANSAPQPSTWGTPTSYLGNGCNISEYFFNHQLVFDITFCGGAGTSYIDSGCPGTCSDRIQEPGNFANASWTINYVHVFGSPDIKGTKAASAGVGQRTAAQRSGAAVLLAIFALATTLLVG